MKSSGKKEKSPENKYKKNKLEFENKSNRLRIDNVLKNQFKPKNNNNKNKSAISKISNMINSKNKSSSNVNPDDDSSFNNAGNQNQQINNNNNQPQQQPQYIKQFKDIISVEKINNNNKININNKNKIKDNYSIKAKIKQVQIGNVMQPQKIINKNEKNEKDNKNDNKSDIGTQKESIQESSISNSPRNKNKNSNNNENHISGNSNQNNYYYYKKEAILKKQQQQRNLNQILNKKDNLVDGNKKGYNQGSINSYISKYKSSDILERNSQNKKINISDDRDTIKENENYLSDENINDKEIGKEIYNNKIMLN